jgi:hypothetical protein
MTNKAEELRQKLAAKEQRKSEWQIEGEKRWRIQQREIEEFGYGFHPSILFEDLMPKVLKLAEAQVNKMEHELYLPEDFSKHPLWKPIYKEKGLWKKKRIEVGIELTNYGRALSDHLTREGFTVRLVKRERARVPYRGHYAPPIYDNCLLVSW